MTRSILAMADLATPMAIRVAATLGLLERADIVADEVSPAVRRLLEHLVAVGVFDLEAGRYRPTDLGAQAAECNWLLDINCAGGRAELAFVELLGTITTGTPAYPQRYGRDFWADIDAEPQLRKSFDAQMNWRFQAQAPQIAERFDWRRFPEILDVGGGDGMVLAAILHANPDVRGRVLDLPPSAAAAAERFAAERLSDRATVVAGSFFDPLPRADACLLSDVLHDWDDDHARMILARCRSAANAVVVIEPVRGRGVDTAMDLFMLMCFGGRERTVDELTALAADCGLRLHESVSVADGRTALEFGRST